VNTELPLTRKLGAHGCLPSISNRKKDRLYDCTTINFQSPDEEGSATLPELSIVYRPVAELQPDPNNPRHHSRPQIRKLSRSMRKLGFNVPLLVDKDDRVIAGHGRLLACQELGITTVPTITLNHLTPEQAKAFQIADNRLCELGEWDDKLLAEAFKGLSFLELELDLELTEADRIRRCRDRLSHPVAGGGGGRAG